MINLVCRFISKISCSPESSEFPDHNGDETNQKDEENQDVKNRQDPCLAHFGTPLEVNGEQFHTVPVFEDSEYEENHKCK